MNLQLDNKHIPKLTKVNPKSPYLMYRRFYCRKKSLVNGLLTVGPLAIAILVLIIINGK
jgi:hypothetical protein